MKPEKIKVIFNGLDTSKILNKRDAASIEKPFAFLVTSLGEVSERKGFDYLIQGFANFLRRSGAKNAGLVIIGDGEKMDAFKRLAGSLGIEKQVIFTGFLDNPYPYLAASDVFAMTSKNEGISNALLEGIYLGNAAISTIAGGVREIIEHGKQGFLVEYGDVEKLGEYLDRLYKDPELRASLACEGYKMVTGTFSMEKMTREIVAFCSNIAAQK
ncbi:MAG: glycosyltransferase [Chlorobiales bacterium]|nr:glycosyltransferase [Chlorobiales bacterium]